MKIFDYQSGKELTDVSIVLSEEELIDLAAYVQKLNQDVRVPCAHLSHFVGSRLASELTVAIEPRVSHA